MTDANVGAMRRSLTLTGVTVNAMALIAPGAFLWTTFETQAALSRHGTSTADGMWAGLLLALVLAMLTAYSYAELARIYPDAGTGSSYYFAEAAFLDKERPSHQRYARFAKLSVGWISHLYYWIYPGIMVAYTATLFGYLYSAIFHHTLSYLPLGVVAVAFACIVGYIAYRGISGSTMTSIAVNVIQITCLLLVSVAFVWFRLAHGQAPGGFERADALHVIIPHNVIDMLYQSTIAILLLVGFESVTALGSEAVNPHRDIKRGVLISLLIQGGVCYLFEYFAANLAIGGATLTTGAGKTLAHGYAAASTDAAPIGDMIKTVGNHYLGNSGQALAVLVAFTVLLALLGTALASLNTAVRITYSMSRDKEMPAVLGLLHGRYASPYGGVLVLTLISAGLGVFGADPHQVDNLTQITLASNLGTFLVYGATCGISLVAFASRHDRHIVKHLGIPALGLTLNVLEMAGVVYIALSGSGTTPGDAYKAIAIVAVWALIGFIWAAVNPHRKTAQAVVSERRQTAVAMN
ncbi:MAG: APC family permease [Acidimicrobiales bacterium]|jgi:amino acid transporter